MGLPRIRLRSDEVETCWREPPVVILGVTEAKPLQGRDGDQQGALWSNRSPAVPQAGFWFQQKMEGLYEEDAVVTVSAQRFGGAEVCDERRSRVGGVNVNHRQVGYAVLAEGVAVASISDF